MKRPAMKVVRHTGRAALMFQSHGMELLGTYFTPAQVANAVKVARERYYTEVHITRRKPVFAKDKFAYTVFGKR